MKKKNALTPKQSMFVKEYLIDLNATQAAIRAGYSKKNADKIGHELLGKTGVSKAISEAIEKREARTEWAQDDVLRRIREAHDEASKRGQMSAAIRALELYGKHLGIFSDKLDLNVDKPFMIVTKAASPANWPKKK